MSAQVPLRERISSGKLATSNGVSYLEVKLHLLLSYCTSLSFYLLLKAEGRSIKDHPVVEKVHLHNTRDIFVHTHTPHTQALGLLKRTRALSAVAKVPACCMGMHAQTHGEKYIYMHEYVCKAPAAKALFCSQQTFRSLAEADAFTFFVDDSMHEYVYVWMRHMHGHMDTCT